MFPDKYFPFRFFTNRYWPIAGLIQHETHLLCNATPESDGFTAFTCTPPPGTGSKTLIGCVTPPGTGDTSLTCPVDTMD